MNKFIETGIKKLINKLEHWGQSFFEMLPNIVIAFIAIIIFVFISRWVYNIVRNIFLRTHISRSLALLIANSSRIIVISFGIIVALSIVELQKTVFSLLAGVGVIGLALGFAFQDLASNFISGIMLAVRSPIKLDDLVEINGTLGFVRNINLRETVIHNFDGQEIFVPNKDFTSSKFINFSSFGRRKIRIDVGIHYDNDAEKAIPIIQKALSKVTGCLDDPAPEAFVGGLGDSSVNLFGFIWYKYPSDLSYYRIQSDSIINVKKDLEGAGYTIPFPIRTLDVSSDLISEFKTDSRSSDPSEKKG